MFTRDMEQRKSERNFKMGELYRKIKEYVQEDYYPYHMPGHKRNLLGSTALPVAEIDITEIDGFDNLHNATEVLKRLQDKAASVYGAEESFYLVNGSTSGILSAVSAALPAGGKLLMARGCHKSAYHAVYLRDLEVKYLWSGENEDYGCNLAVTPQQVEQALLEDDGIQAVFIVSPTYEGMVADVAAIARVVHKRGIPLIVDEAHGAHFGFHPAWPENSCRLGADLVVHSLHKTLPSMTQTAILHVNGELINRDRLKRFLQIYQSSSPSYVLMASMEDAIEITSLRAEELFDAFLRQWNNMLRKLDGCKWIKILQEESMDIGKLVIRDSSGVFSGQQLYRLLQDRFHLQMEMAAGSYVLAMFTIGDKEEAYERMTKALLEIDRECGKKAEAASFGNKKHKTDAIYRNVRLSTKQRIPLKQAWDCETIEVALEESPQHIAGEFIYLYPPGIPLIVPGEEFTEEISLLIKRDIDMGCNVQGVINHNGRFYVKVVDKRA